MDPIALDIFDIIQSEEDVWRQKCAVSGCIFNTKKINDLCNTSGRFELAYDATINPGNKSVNILELSNRFISFEGLKDNGINADDIVEKYKENNSKFTSKSSY